MAVALIALTLSGCLGHESGPRTAEPAAGHTPSDPVAPGAPTTAPPAPTQAAPAEPIPDAGPAPYSENGTLQASLIVGYFWAHQSDGGFTQDGIDQNRHPLTIVDRAPDGRAVGATHLRIRVDPPNPTLDHPPQNLNLYLLSPDGVVLTKSADETWTDPAHFEAEVIEWETEPLPAGAYEMQVVLYFGVGAEWPYTLTWSVDYTDAPA